MRVALRVSMRVFFWANVSSIRRLKRTGSRQMSSDVRTRFSTTMRSTLFGTSCSSTRISVVTAQSPFVAMSNSSL